MAFSVTIPASNITVSGHAPGPAAQAAVKGKLFPLELKPDESPFTQGASAVYDFVVDNAVFHNAPSSHRADLIPIDETAPSVPPPVIRAIYAELRFREPASFRAWIKISSGPARVAPAAWGNSHLGGFAAIGVANLETEALVFSQYLGGWRDWMLVEIPLPAGSYGMFFWYTDYMLEGVGIDPATDWPAPPDGETATNQMWVDAVSTSVPMYVTPEIKITSRQVGPFRTDPPAAAVALAGLPPAGYFTGKVASVSTGSITAAARAPAVAARAGAFEVAAMAVAAGNPSYIWRIPQEEAARVQIAFVCILTGAADGLADLVLPMSSFQARQRNGEPSYLSCVIPNAPAYEPAILARKNGDLVVKKGYRFSDGTLQLEEIARGKFESPAVDQGAGSASVSLTAYRTVSATAPKTRLLENVSVRSLQHDGKRRFRADVDLFLRPGDTAIYGGEAMVAGMITYSVSPRLAVMEVTEA